MGISSGGLSASKAAKEGKLGKEVQGKGEAGGTKGGGKTAVKGYDAGVLSNIGAGPTGTNALGKPTNSTGVQERAPRGTPGGGTTTQYGYVPGAVPNYPEAENPARNLLEGAMVGPTGPVGTATMLGAGAYKALSGDDFSEGPFTDTGPQMGYQPDKYRGGASLTGLGGDGGAVNDERQLFGEPLGAGTQALTGDSEEETPGGAGTGAIYSDVVLQDRRKPKNLDGLGAGSLMALGIY